MNTRFATTTASIDGLSTRVTTLETTKADRATAQTAADVNALITTAVTPDRQATTALQTSVTGCVGK